MKFGFGLVMAQTETILESLPAVVQANGIDALVIDTVQFYAELSAMQLGIPYIHVSNALHLDFSGYTPICYYDWPHQTTASALARNREGVAKSSKRLENANAGIRAYAKSAGLVSIGTTHPPPSRSWPGLPNVLGNLILKVRIGLHSSITPVHSMMAWAGRSWISPGSD